MGKEMETYLDADLTSKLVFLVSNTMPAVL